MKNDSFLVLDMRSYYDLLIVVLFLIFVSLAFVKFRVHLRYYKSIYDELMDNNNSVLHYLVSNKMGREFFLAYFPLPISDRNSKYYRLIRILVLLFYVVFFIWLFLVLSR